MHAAQASDTCPPAARPLRHDACGTTLTARPLRHNPCRPASRGSLCMLGDTCGNEARGTQPRMLEHTRAVACAGVLQYSGSVLQYSSSRVSASILGQRVFSVLQKGSACLGVPARWPACLSVFKVTEQTPASSSQETLPWTATQQASPAPFKVTEQAWSRRRLPAILAREVSIKLAMWVCPCRRCPLLRPARSTYSEEL